MQRMIPSSAPPLAPDEIHLWRTPWRGGAGEAAFAGLLAAYAGHGAPPIVRGIHGKPSYAAPFDTLGFSWSHSGDTALCAVGLGPPGFQIGVDVERVRPRARAVELARRFFAAEEAAALGNIAESQRLAAFLALWTAKEAVLKAHGGGLSYGLHRVAFRLEGGVAVPDRFDGDIGPAEAWSVQPLDLGDSLQGAVAWRGSSRRTRVFTSAL